MKTACFTGMLLFFSTSFAEPLLVVTLMIKDEAAVIDETIRPFIDGGVTDFLIYDTGSTDGTQEVVHRLFLQHPQVQHHLIEEPFTNFADSRNRALVLTEHYFPGAIFVLVPDAEWYIQNVHELCAYCRAHEHETDPAYAILLKNAQLGVDFYIPRLLRQPSHVRFEGVVHETITVPFSQRLPAAVYFERTTSQKGDEKSSQRWLRDYELLHAHCTAHPQDARSWFYLGQTAACLKLWDKAYDFHMKRAAFLGNTEEDYLTQYRLGLIAEKLDPPVSWSQALFHYIKAYALRPQRAEPLIRIAEHYYRTGAAPLCYLFARRACELPFPTQEASLVDTYDYEVTRFALLRAVTAQS